MVVRITPVSWAVPASGVGAMWAVPASGVVGIAGVRAMWAVPASGVGAMWVMFMRPSPSIVWGRFSLTRHDNRR